MGYTDSKTKNSQRIEASQALIDKKGKNGLIVPNRDARKYVDKQFRKNKAAGQG